ncbi:hypothetical protein HU200_004119 [Digitaria exilis]|uniref:Uncharacterized protein n=1 Tax=Digitaria exilis TaxID=1010633 RepID=A0A835FU13_9POAL|nr:hypothetical protein HU200_038290 [Digitaria exilis]KAF8775878.1 hypothetical protein HU200_004119 [Digitaria exilis]
MAAAGAGPRAWVVDVEKTLGEADTSRHFIYHMPACIKDLPFPPDHHGDTGLVSMEKHKRRALHHLLRRAKKPLEEFVVAVILLDPFFF